MGVLGGVRGLVVLVGAVPSGGEGVAVSLGVAAEAVKRLVAVLLGNEVGRIEVVDDGLQLGHIDATADIAQGGQNKGGFGEGEGQVDHRMMMVAGQRMTQFCVRSIFIW